MAQNKSTPIIALGVAVFVVGGALLFFVLNGSKSSTSSSKGKPAVVGTTTSTTRPPGQVVIGGPTATPTTALSFKIPDGQNALSMEMDFNGGVGGFVKQNDQINIYAIVNKDCSDKTKPLTVKLIQSNVKVLEVLGSPPAANGNPANFLLAVTPQQAETLIFFSKGFSLYYTLTTNSEPAATTTGVSCTNSF